MMFLEVIFALAFIYFLGAVIVSGINEAISMFLNKRGLELKRALILLLNGKDSTSSWGDQFFEHPRVKELNELPKIHSIRAMPQRILNFILGRKEAVEFKPSYISASQFADVLIEFIGNSPSGALKQAVASSLEPDELAFIGQMRRFIEAADPYNYKQFQLLFLKKGDQPDYPILTDLRDVDVKMKSHNYQDYQKQILETIDEYLKKYSTMATKWSTLDHLKNKIIQLQDHPNFGAFQQFLSTSGTLTEFKEKLETWYNEYMDRVSGWFKRRMQFTIWIIAACVTILGNIDSIEIIQNLVVKQSFRETVVGAAEKYMKEHPEWNQPAESFEVQMDTLKAHISLTRDLFLPVGLDTVKGFPGISKFAGWILTIFALSLGAPFWFDLMNKFANLRASGKKPSSDE